MKTHRLVVASLLCLAGTLFAGTCLQSHAQVAAPSQPQTAAPAQPQAAAAASPVTTQAQDGFTVVGVSVRTNNQKEAGGNGEIPQLWQQVMQQGTLENVPHRADSNLTIVYTDYSSDASGDYTYVLGVRVTAVDKVPDGMIRVEVPAGKYAVVESEKGSLPEVLPQVWRRIQTMSPAEMGGQRAFKADFEVYPEGFDWQNAQIPVYIGLK